MQDYRVRIIRVSGNDAELLCDKTVASGDGYLPAAKMVAAEHGLVYGPRTTPGAGHIVLCETADDHHTFSFVPR